MHEEQGTMSADDYHTYYELFNAMVMTPYFPKPDVLIYLECDYDEVIDRIQQRDVTWKSIQIQNIGKNYLNGMKIGLTILMHVLLFDLILMNMTYTKT